MGSDGIGTDKRVLATDGTILSVTTTGDFYLGPFYNYGFRAMRVMLEKIAESGTTPSLAWVFEFQSGHDNAWNNMLDHSSAPAQITGLAFAAASSGLRYVDLVAATALPSAGTNGVLTFGTNHKLYETLIPYAIRLKLTLAGTGAVTATIGSSVEGYV